MKRVQLSAAEVSRRCHGLQFGAEIQDYLEWMRAQGYAPRTLRGRLSVLAEFVRYVKARGVSLLEKIAEYVQPFVHCRVGKARKAGRTVDPDRLATEIERGVRLFCRHLEVTERLPSSPETPDLGPFYQAALERFTEFLHAGQALAPSTIRGYGIYIFRFLRGTEAATGINAWEVLSPDQVDSFLAGQARTTGRRGMRNVCSALRGFLRFLQLEGHALEPCLENFPWPRVYQQEDLPRFLRGDQVRAALESVDRTTLQGIRDYAILLLLSTYGMRAIEVARMSLDDVDWSAGRLQLKHRKSGRTDLLPLGIPVGEALLEYLQKARPRTSHRELFLTLAAPVRPFLCGGPVSALARRRLLAAGIEQPRLGAHLFRHTTARHLLSQGFSFKVIGDYLGHSAVSSTSVYLKVDLEGLREVALNDGEELI